MARKATPIGPNILALIEDARIDLARAALAVREGENEPDFKLSDAVPDQADDELPPVSLDIALSERRSRWTSRGTPK